jgi:hypothetical protein
VRQLAEEGDYGHKGLLALSDQYEMACIGEMARSSLESGRSREQKGLLPVPRFILSGAPAFRFHTASGYMIPSFDRFVFDQSQCRSFAGPVEGDALDTDSDLGQIRPHLGVEPIAIHAQGLRRIAQADEARQRPVGYYA